MRAFLLAFHCLRVSQLIILGGTVKLVVLHHWFSFGIFNLIDLSVSSFLLAQMITDAKILA